MQEFLYVVISAFRAFWVDINTGRFVPAVRGGDGSTGVADPPDAVDLSDLAKFPALKDAHEHYAAKRDELAGIFKEAGPDRDLTKVTSVDGGKDAVLERIRALNEEVNDLSQKRDEQITLVKAVKAMERNDDDQLAAMLGESGDGVLGGFKSRKQLKTFGEMVIEAKAHRELKGRDVELGDAEIKTLFQTSAGWSIESTRGPRIIDDEQRPIMVTDLLPQTTTQSPAIKYMEETTFTNNAAETAEGAEKPEAALALTERTALVKKIPIWIPVTDEQLEDEPRAQEYLTRRLGFMVRQRLDGQIVVGDGTGENLTGVTAVSGVQTQAKGVDPTPDAIYKAMAKVEVVGQAMPDAVLLHSYDWQDIRLLRTADGIYIWGNPSDAGPERIWGLRVVKMQVSQNTGVVGDFGNFSELVMRKGLTVKISDSHSDYFIKNKQAVRAELRAAVVWYRPTAFCTVTGI